MSGTAFHQIRFHQINADRGIAPGSTKGAGLHLRGLAAGLLACGHSVMTYSARRPEGVFPVAVQPLEDLASAVIDPGDVIYERYSLGHVGGLELARRTNAPFVLEVNAPLVDEARAHRPSTVRASMGQVEAKLLAEADLVIAVSHDLARWVSERRDRPTVAIGNGFEPGWFPNRSRSLTVPDRLAFLGHPKPWHGADRLPRLLVDLRTLGHRPELMVIGGGPGADALVAQAQELGVDGQITVTGPLPPHRAAGVLATATIGLAPYPRLDRFYFCPLKVIDYLAAGLAVVSTRQGALGDMVRTSGLLVEPEDDAALAGAVAELLADPDRRSVMGAAGRRRALAEMTWHQVARRTTRAIAAAETTIDPVGVR